MGIWSMELYITLFLLFPALSEGSGGFPEYIVQDTLGQSPADVLQKNVILDNKFVTLNAAASAKISIDGPADNTECGQGVNISGSIQCIEEYIRYQSFNSRATPAKYDAYQCNDPLQVAYKCKEVTDAAGAADTLTEVSTDTKSLVDSDFGTVWIHEMTDSPVTITLDLPEPFKVNIIVMAVETIPINTEIYSSINGGEETLLGRLPAIDTECPDSDFDCFYYGYYSVRMLWLDLIDPDFDPLLPIDKLRIKFSGTKMLRYNISHLIIREIYLSSTCACASGNCSTEIDLSSERSRQAMYSCDCSHTPTIGGFLCDQCATSYYNKSGECLPCGCGYGATNKSCDDGVCTCDSTLYSGVIPPDTKCSTPYISEISPTAGAVQGGTLVTVKGGLLTQIKLDFCNEVDRPCVDCPSRDAEVVCSMTSGNVGTKHLITAPSPTGNDVIYNFTYIPQYKLRDIQPRSAFTSGGRDLTVVADALQYANSVTLEYTVKCLLSSDRPSTYKQLCRVVNDTTAVCPSLNFCNITNTCRTKGSENPEHCTNENAGSLGATSGSVSIELAVTIDGTPVEKNGSALPFRLTRDPVINKWENSLLTITRDAQDFTVPGQYLDEGASFSDYRIVIDGVKVKALDVNETRLRVQWPHPRMPVGLTTVSVGGISKIVGDLAVEEEESEAIPWVAIGASIAAFVLLLVIVIIAVIVWRRKSQLAIEKHLHKLAYKPGNVRYVKRNGEIAFIPLSHLASDNELVEQLKPFLIDKERLSLSTQLGAGQFGKVFKGNIQLDDGRHKTVAAKTLKFDSGVTEEIVCNFLKEATLMSNFNHANVLSLIGVVYAEGNMPIVVLPYMQHGDIRGLLHKDDEVFVLGDLLHFSMQIARGMEYLADRRFIHRDLAARNCMVDGDYMVKIADFGLSHDIYEDDYYRTDESSSKPLPVKWMAIESLNSGKFTTHSDVWSYGIVMWELLTRGVTPYPSVSNYEIKSYLQDGNRLQQPQYCPDFVFEMMQSCWLTEPSYRPTFSDLANKLSDILRESNYEERAKTRGIKSDYYLQPVSMDEFDQLYLKLIE